jgi:hypothetical protein
MRLCLAGKFGTGYHNTLVLIGDRSLKVSRLMTALMAGQGSRARTFVGAGIHPNALIFSIVHNDSFRLFSRRC